jgi:hypothetical protein
MRIPVEMDFVIVKSDDKALDIPFFYLLKTAFGNKMGEMDARRALGSARCEDGREE